ncbi:hypothetical protein BGS_0545 [Beggiatoa sp. SS]|nr:hypothetical protein BGS_0545 [Beggiatoa sp. SS]
MCGQNAELPRAEAIQPAIGSFFSRYFKAAFLGRLVIVPYPSIRG